MESIEGLDRRVTALEARVRANEVDMSTVNEKLNGIIGGQDVMFGILIGHGQRLDGLDQVLATHSQMLEGLGQVQASHSQVLDSHGAKLDLIVNWIQSQP